MLLKYSSHSKVILLGEHAVLRGKSAIVLPMSKFNISLHVRSSAKFNISIADHFDHRLEAVLAKLLDKSLRVLGYDLHKPKLDFYIDGNFPIGQGLGFSAALCLVVANWSIDYTNSSEMSLVNLAKFLEQDFHGESSGIDVIGVNSQSAKLFYSIDKVKDIDIVWSPNLYLSLFDCYKSTKDCVGRVKKINSSEQFIIDNKMQRAVDLALQAFSKQNAISLLAESIKLGCSCFNEWGLIDKWQQQEINALYKKGAVAVKPTGAGGGGLISLWDKTPLDNSLISINNK